MFWSLESVISVVVNETLDPVVKHPAVVRASDMLVAGQYSKP